MHTGFFVNRSLQFKLTCALLPLAVIPALLVSLLFHHRYINDFQNQSIQGALQTAEQISYNLTAYLDELFKLTEMPYYNSEIMKALDNTPNTELERLEKRRIVENFLAQMMISPRKDIISAYIISEDIYHGGKYNTPVSDKIPPESYNWYKQALKKREPLFVPVHREILTSRPKYDVFSVVRRINKISNPNEHLAVIKIDANYDGITNILDKASFGNEGGLYILDENKNIVYQSREDLNIADIQAKRDSETSSSQLITMEKKQYWATFTSMNISDWTILTLSSVEEMSKSANEARGFTYIVALISAMITMLVVWLILRGFLKPLKNIVNLMKLVKKGNLNVEFPQNRTDEIGELGIAFNNMLGQIKLMLHNVSESKQLQAQAQMNSLYNQIHPHFLFNTLNLISLCVRCGQYDNAVQTIQQLGDLLRTMIKMGEDISLREEILLIENYLSIQARRFPNRLFYSVDMQKKWDGYRLPALLLQPIVENSVLHGYENDNVKTVIEISARDECGRLYITIDDNAGGITSDILQSIKEDNLPISNKGASNGIGLQNVSRRIKLRYGDSYGLEIANNSNGGVSVTLILPCE